MSKKEYDTLESMGSDLYDALHNKDKVDTGKIIASIAGATAMLALNHLRNRSKNDKGVNKRK